MKVQDTSIEGLLVIEPDRFGDDRGFFMESYRKDRYQEVGVRADFVQDNVSLSKRGVLRGLHFQRKPFAQGKLVSVLKGGVWDVAVDIRKDSSTFGKWYGIELSAKNYKQFWIPEGFAHGFATLEDDTLFTYKCTHAYAPEYEGSILWNDPELAISWPITDVIVSDKDKNAQLLKALKEVYV